MALEVFKALRRVAATGLLLLLATAHAQVAAPRKKAEPPRTAAPAAKAPERAGTGWRSGPRGAWVVDPPGLAELNASAPMAGTGGRRDLLVDVQSSYLQPRAEHYSRLRMAALDAAVLGVVSQPQIVFNPAFQTVVLHEVALWRDGRRIDRLADARIELMRREQRLEQQVIDGAETLLVMLNDVRVGDVVETAYTVVGENPIFEGRIATGMRVAWDTPVDLLHYRVSVPAGRELQVRGMAGAPDPERSAEGGRQVIRVLRQRVAAIPGEQSMPPWFKLHPAVLVSEYRDWAAVDAWAQRLFVLPAAADPALAARAAEFRATGLQGEALVAEVLRFVQDEVRYFSVSLGESSHRPKPPQQTLAERVGDCKDKTMLLTALLRELGFDARPALVSNVRNRGLVNFLPGHDEFDHVIVRLELNGRRWWLDGTMTGQGRTLAGRGHWPYGVAMVVGGEPGLQLVALPPEAVNALEFEQRWDFSQPSRAATLRTVFRARGLAAERWRAAVASVGEARVAEPLGGVYTRLMPGLRATGSPRLSDDRDANVLELVQTFEHPNASRYGRGAIEVDLAAVELLDALVGPPEPRRRTPYHLDQPRVVDSRVEVIAPRPLSFRAPAPTELVDRHFRLGARVEVEGNRVAVRRHLELRTDEVLPEHVEEFRQNLLKGRQSTSGSVRLALLDVQALMPQLQQAERRVTSARGYRKDKLADLQAGNEFTRVFDSAVLALPPAGALKAQVLASRAQASNLAGEFAAGLADADEAIALDARLEPALEARGVALVGLGRTEDALAAFQPMLEGARRATALAWMGALQLQAGRAAEAERLLRDAVDASGGDDREFALLWLCLAAEDQGAGRCKTAVAAHLDGADAQRLPGALLRMMAGSLDDAAVLKVARAQPEMERLRLAEAGFYIGRHLQAAGRADDARRWYERVLDTGAVPYREFTFAKLALARPR